MAGNCCKYFTVSLVPVAALLLAFLFAAGIITLPILHTELAKKYEYGMVIDAGSSHTSLYIYNLDVPITGSLGEVGACQVNESLNDGDPSKASSVIHQLLNCANQTLSLDEMVPSRLFPYIPVYLGATAGMRLLRRENATAAANILSAAKNVIHNSGFKHKSTVVISGVEEAASGWTTANYILRKRNKAQELVGSLDMGGASTEIAFQSDTKSRFLVTERLVGKLEHLYARSYLCYGYREAHGRFLAHLVLQADNSTVNVSDPCMPSHVVKVYNHSDVYRSCVDGPDGEEVFGFALHPPTSLFSSSSSSKGKSISFKGDFNIDKCLETVQTVFNFTACNSSGVCNTSDVYEPPVVNGTFVGFSGFQYIASILNLTKTKFNSTHPLLEVVQESCKNLSKNSATSSETAGYCFSGVFMGYMVEKGFGMDKNNNNWTLEFKKTENELSFTWALGYYMNKTYEFKEEPYNRVTPFTTVDMVVGMIILTILCAVFVIFFFLTFYVCKKALKSHDGYQSIS